MKNQFVVYEIKDEAVMRSWGKSLMEERNAEAVESLKKEQVEIEMMGYFAIGQKKYIAGFAMGDMLPADMQMPLNREHKEILTAMISSKIPAELLYCLTIPKVQEQGNVLSE